MNEAIAFLIETHGTERRRHLTQNQYAMRLESSSEFILFLREALGVGTASDMYLGGESISRHRPRHENPSIIPTNPRKA
jgi:hypothetical protein